MSDAKSLAGGGEAGARSGFAMRFLEAWARQARIGQVTIVAPDGTARHFAGSEPGPSATMHVHRGRTVWRVLTGGELGLAESYMDGDWSTPDLAALLEFGLRNEEAFATKMKASWPVRIAAALRHLARENSRAGARRNIAYHYDLGNAFYARWLDETMTYSSALFEPAELSLADAQRRKYNAIIEAIDIRPGERVLEIGCGWGGFMEAAAALGASVTGLTLSAEQAKYARQRLADAGLAERTDVRLEDYRDATGSYDKIVSIEMFEAVGERHWPAYFNAVRERLAPGGRAALQIITIADERFEAYRKTVDFIQRYIFPGGMLPSPSALYTAIRDAGLVADALPPRFFGKSYAKTLNAWNACFQREWPNIAPLGFDDRFRRMWTYYLGSCEACFGTGVTDVGHFLLRKA